MDTDIQFGEVEEESPRKNLRPDRNKHYAVAAYGTPVEGELPIFVDLDVIRDMEDHAQSDTTVELGGVLLGGHYEDDDGQPFVLVTDSLRAQHYESTKGSFKFTHDTWSTITRERDQFPEDLQMAGWYHTHPDWGVFLSGMDMFICDNFFNKKLDVAYVIDPCRGDRGMFQWTGEERQRVRRTGGFYIVASRFRQAELEHYTALLQGNSAMPNLPQSGYGAPVINVAPARHDPQPWQGPAVLGMLAMQFCLLALIAWKMVSPSEPARGDGNTQVAAKLDDLIRAERLKERITTQTQVLDAVLANLKSTEPGFVQKLERQLDKTQDLALDVDTYRSQLAAQKHAEELTRAKLTSIESDLERTKEYLGSRIKDLQEKSELLSQEKADARAELAVLKEKLNPKAKAGDGKEDGGKLAGISYIWWLVGGSVVLLGAVAGVAIALRKPASPENVEAAKAAEERKEVRSETN